MATNDLDTLKSYLVSLGFTIDKTSYNKFNRTLDALTKGISKDAAGWASTFKLASISITTALGAIATATVYMMNKVGKADLDYKLFAMHMYMSEDAAKKLKIATDALGYSIEDITGNLWNKELRGRYEELIKLQERFGKAWFGPDYEKQMKRVRDISFEFTKLKVVGVLAMQTLTYEIMKAMGGTENFHLKMKDLHNWIKEGVPTWIPEFKKISEIVLPELQYAFNAARDAAKVLGDAIGGITSVLSDGESERASFLDWLGSIVYILSAAVGSLAFIGKSIWNIGDASLKFTTGRWWELKDVWEDEKKAWKDYNDPLDLDARGTEKLNRAGREAARAPDKQKGLGGKTTLRDLVRKYLPGEEDKALAVINAESGGRPWAHNPGGGGTGAFGLFQIRGTLHESALRKAGIIGSQRDLFDPETNVRAARYLYNNGGWNHWDESKSKWNTQKGYEGGQKIGDTVINVNVANTNAAPEEIARRVADVLARERMATMKQSTSPGGS